VAGGGPGWLCSRRDRAAPAQHQGGEAPSETVATKTGYEAEADHHRQIAILWRSNATNHAQCRASLAQGSEQSGRELACPTAQAGTHHATVSISWSPPTLRVCLLCRPQSLRSAPFKTLSPAGPHSSPSSHGAMESRHIGNLNYLRQPGAIRQSAVNLTSPTKQVAERANVKGFIFGPSADVVYYNLATK
jgi:hypothetical protein